MHHLKMWWWVRVAGAEAWLCDLGVRPCRTCAYDNTDASGWPFTFHLLRWWR